MKTDIKVLCMTGLSLAGIFFTAGCRKDNTAMPPPSATSITYASLSDFFSRNGVQSQTFNLDAGTGGTVNGSKGTIISFPDHAFVTKSNVPVTGTVNVDLKEILTKKNMLLSNRPTVYFGNPLVSGGEYYLRVTQNGQELKLAPGKRTNASIPTDSNLKGMMAFYGVLDSIGHPGWTYADSSSYYAPASNPVTIASNNYRNFLACDSMNWVNCDQFPDASATWTSLQVRISNMGSLAPAQTSVFIYYDTHNCIFPLYSIGGTGYMTSECWLGQRVHIIVIGLDLNGKVYSSVQSVTVASNLVVTATVASTTAEAVVAQIAALP